MSAKTEPAEQDRFLLSDVETSGSSASGSSPTS